MTEVSSNAKIESAHFIGIGGAGMSGIALVLHERGCKVTGSDLKASHYVRELEDAGIEVHVGHEAATIDAVMPQVIVTSTAIPETMWVWNDYLLPTLVLDIKKYRTIPMAIQYFRGGYGRVELAPMMACIIIAIIPIIILYMTCQKYIIEGVVAGAVKG